MRRSAGLAVAAELTFTAAPTVATALAALGLAGCGGTSGGTSGDAGPTVIGAADVHVLGTSESIAQVVDLAALPDGTVWVLNSLDPRFVGFGPDGGSLGEYGRQGGGPDEFRAPAGFVTGGLDGQAWVFDRGRHALIRIAGPDAPHAEIPLPPDAIPAGSVMQGMSLLASTVRTARLGDLVVLPRRIGSGEVAAISFWTTIWNADLVALDPETGSVSAVVSLPDALGDLEARFAELGSGFIPFPMWYRLWATCGDELRLYDFVRDELRGFDADGTERDPAAVPPPFTEVTPRQFALSVFDLAAAERAGEVRGGLGDMSAADSAQIIDGLVARLDRSPAQLAGLLPKFVDFRCAEDGTMWLRPIDLERGGMRGGPTWLRIARDGTRREVRLPERFDPYRFAAGRIWGVLRDELDVASLAWTADPGG